MGTSLRGTPIFFAIAFVLNHSGKSAGAAGGAWVPTADGGINMVKVVADACAGAFQQAYSGVAAFLGLLGGFISGSEASSIAMLSAAIATAKFRQPGLSSPWYHRWINEVAMCAYA